MINVKNEIILFFTFNIWNNDSNGIYDYTSTKIKKIKVFISKPTYIINTDNNLFLNLEQHAEIQNRRGDELMFHVNNDTNNTYILSNPIPNNLKLNQTNFDYLNNKIWYVLKPVDLENHDKTPNFNEDYYLNPNDIIKIGNVKYAVQKIYLLEKESKLNCPDHPMIPVIESKYNISDLNKNLNPVFEFTFPVKYTDNYIKGNVKNNNLNDTVLIDIYECKYCKKNDINQKNDDGDNFLISVCKCKELVHYKCLKNYLKNLQVRKDENENTPIYDEVMTFENFECPICKNQFPIKFKLANNDNIFDLIDIKEPKDCNFMILESIDYKQNDKYCKSIHIIKFIKKKGEPFTFGTDSDNDIIEKDISISRHHAILKFNNENGQITLQNWKGKYGTLVLIRKPFKILDKPIYLQIGKTYIEAKLMKKEDFLEEIENNLKVIIAN